MTQTPDSFSRNNPDHRDLEARSSDPAQEIAISLFTTLGLVSAAGMVLGYPFWVQKGLTTAIFGVLLASNLIGRWLAQRGRHELATHIFAALTMLMAVPLMLFSVHVTAPTLMLVTILPVDAAAIYLVEQEFEPLRKVTVNQLHGPGVASGLIVVIRGRFFDKFVTHGERDSNGSGTYSARLLTEAKNGSVRLEVSDADDTTATTLHLPKALLVNR